MADFDPERTLAAAAGPQFTTSPRRRGRGQILSNLRQELARADGFRHVGIATRRTRLVLSLIQLISCDGNDRYSVQRRVGFEAAGCLITVELQNRCMCRSPRSFISRTMPLSL